MPDALRKTQYAELCAEAKVDSAAGDELRAERLWVKGKSEEQLRLTRWKSGRMVPQAPSMSEAELLALLERGIAKGVFTPFFLRQLLGVMERNTERILTD